MSIHEYASRKVPKNISECLTVDPFTTELSQWSSFIEASGKVLLWIQIIGGVIGTIALSYTKESEYYASDPEFSWLKFIIILLVVAIGCFIWYCTYHSVALSLEAKARINANTQMSAKLAALQLSTEINNAESAEKGADQTGEINK